MFDFNVKNGSWHQIETEEEFNEILNKGGGRVKKGYWSGSGRYLSVWYSQPCPRGCCYDDVHKLVFVDDVKDIVKEEIQDLLNVLGQKTSLELLKEITDNIQE